MKRTKFAYSIKLILLFLGVFTQACIPLKEVSYMKNTDNDDNQFQYSNVIKGRKIKALDELYIKVMSTDEKTAQLFSMESSERYNFNLNLITYRVDESGYIAFPFIGKVNVVGKTLADVKPLLESKLSEYISNANVIIKYVNNKITVLGEVTNPGTYYFAENYISIFDAVGLAGGIDQYGNKKDITLVRTKGDKISYYCLDLTKKNIAESEFFYLQPKDVIIVNPIRFKFWTMQTGTVSVVLSTVTTLVAVLYYYNAAN